MGSILVFCEVRYELEGAFGAACAEGFALPVRPKHKMGEAEPRALGI